MVTSPVHRILVPVDLSDASRDALRFASSLAQALGASIEVLHVTEPSSRLLGGGPPGASGAETAAPRDLLHQFVASVSGAGSTPPTERVETGDPRDRIVSIAEQDGFDLIVMGTRGRTGRVHVLVGSVAESVVRTSVRPVLTVRESAS